MAGLSARLKAIEGAAAGLHWCRCRTVFDYREALREAMEPDPSPTCQQCGGQRITIRFTDVAPESWRADPDE